MNTLRFHVLGDSLAAGVGCTRADQTLGHRLSDTLRRAGHQVDLSLHAVSGARSTDLAPQVRSATAAGVDLALVVIGANDLISFTPPQAGARLLGEAVRGLTGTGAAVVVATTPDLSIVTAVPEPFRDVVRQVSAAYAQAQADAVDRAGGSVAAVGAELFDSFRANPALFSGDRFHPSPAGYALIADALAPHLLTAATRHAA
ncbi:SGNH hydrolase [Actinokineospora bangkokensis]|uniref:SGNH hydrolase n=2 Tax=Actinokineospora bangkokensis TaxID=1193682 RepID=A0A1Q9LN80_9PSEU|nr:SGNH hydrolase [Actinokineospora bangkokensis]